MMVYTIQVRVDDPKRMLQVMCEVPYKEWALEIREDGVIWATTSMRTKHRDTLDAALVPSMAHMLGADLPHHITAYNTSTRTTLTLKPLEV